MRPPLRLRTYIAAVAGSGAGALIVAALMGRHDGLHKPIILLAFTIAIALSWVFPLFVLHKRETEVLVLDEAFFIAMALLFPPFEIILALGLGMAVGLILRSRGIHKTIFNTGQTMTAAGAGLAVMYSFRPDIHTVDLRLVAAALAGAFVFFLVQMVAVSIAISISERVRLRSSLTRGLDTRILVWSGNVSVGLLAGIIGHWHAWAIAFTVIPIAVLQVVYNGHIRSQRDRDRMNGLLDTATRAHMSIGTDEVEKSIKNSVSKLLRCDGIRFDPLPPGSGEVGARLQIGGPGDQWLVAFGKQGVEPFDEADQHLLEAVAAIGQVALQNASLFQEAKEERRKLADVVGSSSDGIFSVDPNGTITSWNSAMERISGYPAAEMTGTRHLGALRPRDLDGRDVLVAGWTRNGKIPVTDIQILDAQGENRWLSCTYSRMSDGGYVIVARDVTAEREIEQLKADFLATVSHELRTPLTPIQGFMQTLLRDDISFNEAERKRFYKTVLRQTQRLTRLLNDLLDAVRLQSQDTVLRPEPVDWTQTVTGVVDIMIHQSTDRDISLEIRGNLPMAMADSHRGEQILTNLLSNAEKYSEADSPIKVVVAPTMDSIVTSVIDRGHGIGSADRERIFERFTRLGDHLTRPQGGLGLGLFISRRLVEAMGGRIWVESNPEGGSVFSFTLPIYEPDEALLPLSHLKVVPSLEAESDSAQTTAVST